MIGTDGGGERDARARRPVGDRPGVRPTSSRRRRRPTCPCRCQLPEERVRHAADEAEPEGALAANASPCRWPAARTFGASAAVHQVGPHRRRASRRPARRCARRAAGAQHLQLGQRRRLGGGAHDPSGPRPPARRRSAAATHLPAAADGRGVEVRQHQTPPSTYSRPPISTGAKIHGTEQDATTASCDAGRAGARGDAEDARACRAGGRRSPPAAGRRSARRGRSGGGASPAARRRGRGDARRMRRARHGAARAARRAQRERDRTARSRPRPARPRRPAARFSGLIAVRPAPWPRRPARGRARHRGSRPLAGRERAAT